MALSKQTQIDKIEILSNGVIQMQEKTCIFEDSVEISQMYSRTTFAPSADTAQLPEQVKKIANVVWSADVVERFAQENQIANI